MTKKEIVKNEIEMKMRSHLNREQMAILENILSEVLYHFEIIEVECLPANSGITRRVYPHLFRKTTATNILKRGGTDSDAGEYLGHKPQGVTARHYAFRSEDHTVKIFESYVAAI